MKRKVGKKTIDGIDVTVTQHEPLEACELMFKIREAGGNLLRRDILVPLLSCTLVVAPDDDRKGKRIGYDLSDSAKINEAFTGRLQTLTKVLAFASEVNFETFTAGKRNAVTAADAAQDAASDST